MEAAKNPYRKGSSVYIAWEFGYLAALDDVKKSQEEESEEDDQK